MYFHNFAILCFLQHTHTNNITISHKHKSYVHIDYSIHTTTTHYYNWITMRSNPNDWHPWHAMS